MLQTLHCTRGVRVDAINHGLGGPIPQPTRTITHRACHPVPYDTFPIAHFATSSADPTAQPSNQPEIEDILFINVVFRNAFGPVCLHATRVDSSRDPLIPATIEMTFRIYMGRARRGELKPHLPG